MNRYYSYPNIELWKTDMWADKVAPLAKLIQHIQKIDTAKESDYVPSYEYDDLFKHPLYREKTHGIDDPAVVADLNNKGLHYLCTGQGGCNWFCICPQKAIDNWSKLPVLLAFEHEDRSTPLWTMRAVKRYQNQIDMLARTMDFILIVLVNEHVDKSGIFFNIMQEASVLFPCDINNIYLDISKVLAKEKLKDISGYIYLDKFGKSTDPDAAIEKFGEMQIPVLNIYGNWNSCDSLERGLVVTYNMNEGRFDREWFIHSEVGKRMAQDMLYEFKYENVNDPKLQQEMNEKGLVYEVRFNKFGDRYLMAVPRQAVEDGQEIPIVLILQEVYEGNEHLAVTAHSYCGEWLEIAAQGECALMIYALEDIISNDRAVDMVKEEAKRYPLDLSRVYVTGHSHDGYFTYAFANRNPDFVTAIATLGINVCPVGMNDVPDYNDTHNIINYDIPIVNIAGLCESRFPVDEEDKNGRWVDSWKQVFTNNRIPGKTAEDILAAFDSNDYTQRTTCLAGDHFQTLWADGIEHYIVDFINEDGKNHLRVIRQQNMPHTITPFMCTLSWDFLRRFKRDPETKKIIELY